MIFISMYQDHKDQVPFLAVNQFYKRKDEASMDHLPKINELSYHLYLRIQLSQYFEIRIKSMILSIQMFWENTL